MLVCATVATPLVKNIRGASQYVPCIVCPSVAHIPDAPLTDYVWRIWQYAPLMLDASLAVQNMRH
jgi:hypothetical protein